MSINAIGHAANIWSRATTALTSSPTVQGLDVSKPNEAGSSKAKPTPLASQGSTNPFQSLSSDLQSALIQMQKKP
jgi:hypothetical protein